MRRSASEVIRNLEVRVARLERQATLKIKPRNESANAFFDAIVEAVVAVIGQQGQDRSSKKVLVGNVLLETEVIYRKHGFHQNHSVGFTDQSLDNLYEFLEGQNIDFRTIFKLAIHKRWLRERVESYANAFEEIVDKVRHIPDSIR